MAASVTETTEELQARRRYWSPRRDACWDLLEQRTRVSRDKNSRIDEWTGCWIWVFDRRAPDREKSNKATNLLFRPRCLRRSNVWRHGTASLSLVELAYAVRPDETVTTRFYPVPLNKNSICSWLCSRGTNFDSALIFCRTKYGADASRTNESRVKHAVAVAI